MVALADDAVLFPIRMPRDELSKDLDAAFDEIKSTVQRAKGEIDSISKSEVKPRFSVDEQDIRNRMANIVRRMRQDARDQAIELQVRTRLFGSHGEELDPNKGISEVAGGGGGGPIGTLGAPAGPDPLDVGGLLRQSKEITDAANQTQASASATAGAIGAAAAQAGQLFRTLSQVARIAAVIQVAVQAIGLAEAAWALAVSSDDHDARLQAVKETEETIKGLPIVGDKILKLGGSINEVLVKTDNFLRGIKESQAEYAERIKDATTAQDKHTEALAKQAKVRSDQNKDAISLSGSVGSKVDPRLSEELRVTKELADEKKRLLEATNIRDRAGNITDTAAEARKTGLQQIKNAEIANESERQERVKQTLSSIAVMELESIGKKDQAERVGMQETHRARESAAKKRSSEELSYVRLQNEAEMRALDQRQRRATETLAKDTEFRVRQNLARAEGPMAAFAAQQSATRKSFDDQLRYETDTKRRVAIERERDSALFANSELEKKRIEDSVRDSNNRMRQASFRMAGQTFRAEVDAFQEAADHRIRIARSTEEKIVAEREKTVGLEEIRARRIKETGDIRFEAQQIKRRRQGQGAEAEVLDTQRQLDQDLRAASGDKDRQGALIERAEQQIRSVRPEERSAAVISGSDASRLNLRGGTQENKLLKVQQDALGLLTKIERKIGIARTT